jgi:hypothetical protein
MGRELLQLLDIGGSKGERIAFEAFEHVTPVVVKTGGTASIFGAEGAFKDMAILCYISYHIHLNWK